MAGNRITRYFFLGLSVLFLGVLGYKWFELGGAISQSAMLLYYGVPIFLFCASLACAFMPASVRTILVLCLAPLGASIWAAEIFVGLTSIPDREIKHRAFISKWAEQGIDYDPRQLLKVVEDLRDSGVEAYPKLNPGTVLARVRTGVGESALKVNGAELIPMGTISNTLSVYCNELGDYLVYTSDEHGFHNPAGLWGADEIQIAALGDSATEGACVPSSQNMAALLRQHYPLTLNLGMGGNGPLMELAALTEYLIYKRPKVVLWFYLESNDVAGLEGEATSPLLMRYLDEGFSQNLAQRQPSIDRAIRAYMDRNMARIAAKKQGLDLSSFILLRNLRSKLSRTFHQKTKTTYYSDRSLPLLRRILATAKSRTESWGGKFVFVYLPSQPAQPAESKPSRRFPPRVEILAIARELGLHVIDPSPDMWAPPGFYSRIALGMGHYNEAGNRVVAHKVLGVLEDILGPGIGPPAPLLKPAPD